MEENHDFNGFSYKMDSKAKGLESFQLEHPKNKPESIYKYYGVSSYSIEALRDGYFYASHPMELNDHLDSSNFLLGASKPLDIKYYKDFMGEAFGDESKLKHNYDKDSLSDDGFFAKGFIAQLWQVMSNIFGIVSLTSQDKNDLMWPHYTNEQGFQLKFHTAKLEASVNSLMEEVDCLGLYPMNYCRDLHPIDLSDFTRFHIPFLYLTNVKKEAWSYEDEWRFIISKPHMGIPYSKVGLNPRKDHKGIKENRRAYYDKTIVKEITLGSNFFTAREFDIDRSNDKFIIIKPIEGKYNYQNHVEFLNYIHDNHMDKVFYSGKTFGTNDDGQPYLIRTKERLDIHRLDENKYKLTRTNDFY